MCVGAQPQTPADGVSKDLLSPQCPVDPALPTRGPRTSSLPPGASTTPRIPCIPALPNKIQVTPGPTPAVCQDLPLSTSDLTQP